MAAASDAMPKTTSSSPIADAINPTGATRITPPQSLLSFLASALDCQVPPVFRADRHVPPGARRLCSARAANRHVSPGRAPAVQRLCGEQPSVLADFSTTLGRSLTLRQEPAQIGMVDNGSGVTNTA